MSIMGDSMTDAEVTELEQSGEWEDPVARAPVKSPRAVVSVAFTRSDLERIEQAAQAHQMKTSEFIRHAALRSASPPMRFSTVVTGVVVTAIGVFRGTEPQVKVSTPRSALTVST